MSVTLTAGKESSSPCAEFPTKPNILRRPCIAPPLIIVVLRVGPSSTQVSAVYIVVVYPVLSFFHRRRSLKHSESVSLRVSDVSFVRVFLLHRVVAVVSRRDRCVTATLTRWLQNANAPQTSHPLKSNDNVPFRHIIRCHAVYKNAVANSLICHDFRVQHNFLIYVTNTFCHLACRSLSALAKSTGHGQVIFGT